MITEGAVSLLALTKEAVSSLALTEGAVSLPALTEGAVSLPALTEGAVSLPALTEGAVSFLVLTEGAVSLPALTEGAVSPPVVSPVGVLTCSEHAAVAAVGETLDAVRVSEHLTDQFAARHVPQQHHPVSAWPTPHEHIRYEASRSPVQVIFGCSTKRIIIWYPFFWHFN